MTGQTETRLTRCSRHILRLFAAVVLVTAAVLSCSENKVKVMSQGKLEDVLYDYHLADAMAHTTNVAPDEYDAYLDAVLEKHGITRAEFDSSMVYYMKYADKMLEKRQNELVAKLFPGNKGSVNATRLVVRALELRILDIDNLVPDDE